MWHERGAGGNNVTFIIAGSTVQGHISEFPQGTYKKGHRHNAGAHICAPVDTATACCGWRTRIRPTPCGWTGSSGPCSLRRTGRPIISTSIPRTGRPATLPSTPAVPGTRCWWTSRRGAPKADVSIKEGGIQVEYEDEDPRVLGLFEEECRKTGQTSIMREYIKEKHGIAR